MDEISEEKEFDPLAPKDELLEEDELDVPVPLDGVLPIVKPVVKDDEDVDDVEALIDEEEGGLDDFGSDGYNAPDND